MTSDVTQLRMDTDELARPGGLLDLVEDLVPDQIGDPSTGTTSRQHIHSQAPWHTAAAETLMLVHAGVRDLEAKLAYVAVGTRRERGPSPLNTRHALRAVPDLAATAGRPHVDHARKDVESWCRQARQLRDIDQEERWEPLPRQPGHTAPPCPYCHTYALRWSPTVGVVRCTNTDCWDPAGYRPRARMDTGPYSGQPALIWRDHTEMTYPEQEHE